MVFGFVKVECQFSANAKVGNRCVGYPLVSSGRFQCRYGVVIDGVIGGGHFGGLYINVVFKVGSSDSF